jgi:integrase
MRVRRTVGRLTPKQVQHAKPTGGHAAVLLADGGNLYLQCTLGADGSIRRSWLFRYQFDFQRHEMGLGPLHTIGLAEARDRARELRQQVKIGIDPLDARREAKRERLAKKAEQAKVITFRQCAEMYLAAHSESWKNPKHRAQWKSTLEAYAYPVIGALAVSDIDTAHVVKAIEPIWKKIPETASRLRARIESVLGYATVREFRSGDNPARWRGHLAELLPAKGKVRKVKHHAALPYSEVPVFMVELRGRKSVSAAALEFTVLTATRTNEVIGARWDEIDSKEKTWVVSGARMKAGKEHRVPLSDRAVAILKALPRHGTHVFASADGEPLSNMAMLELLRGMRPATTVHGFRSSFRDWAAERTNYPNHVVEMALAHAVGDKVEKAYRRGDLLAKRHRLMVDWAKYCAQQPAADDNVTPFRQKATL